MKKISSDAHASINSHLSDAGEAQYPTAAVDQLRRDGVFGVGVSPEWGGTQESPDDVRLVMQDLANAWQPLAGLLGTHVRACAYVAQLGTAEQKSRWLPAMASGELIFAHAYHESRRPVLQQFETRVLRGEVSGWKDWVTNVAHADKIIVIARGENSTHAVVIDPSADGVLIGNDHPRPGMRGVSLAPLSLDRVAVDVERDSIGGAQLDASAFIEQGERTSAIGFSARAIGSAMAAWEVAKRVVEVEGGVDAPSHRRLRLAELWTKIVAMRGALQFAAETGSREDALAAKVFTSNTVQQVLVDVVQLCGGDGYTDSRQTLARHARDALALVLIDTPNDAMLDRISQSVLE